MLQPPDIFLTTGCNRTLQAQPRWPLWLVLILLFHFSFSTWVLDLVVACEYESFLHSAGYSSAAFSFHLRLRSLFRACSDASHMNCRSTSTFLQQVSSRCVERCQLCPPLLQSVKHCYVGRIDAAHCVVDDGIAGLPGAWRHWTLGFGSSGSGAPFHLHEQVGVGSPAGCDSLDQSPQLMCDGHAAVWLQAFNLVLVGTKRWFVYPPNAGHYTSTPIFDWLRDVSVSICAILFWLLWRLHLLGARRGLIPSSCASGIHIFQQSRSRWSLCRSLAILSFYPHGGACGSIGAL